MEEIIMLTPQDVRSVQFERTSAATVPRMLTASG